MPQPASDGVQQVQQFAKSVITAGQAASRDMYNAGGHNGHSNSNNQLVPLGSSGAGANADANAGNAVARVTAKNERPHVEMHQGMPMVGLRFKHVSERQEYSEQYYAQIAALSCEVPHVSIAEGLRRSVSICMT